MAIGQSVGSRTELRARRYARRHGSKNATERIAARYYRQRATLAHNNSGIGHGFFTTGIGIIGLRYSSLKNMTIDGWSISH